LPAPLRLASLVLCAALASACGSPSGAGPADPWGRAFLSVEVTEGGQPRPLVEGTQITLTFGEDERTIGAYAGCNHMGGRVDLGGRRLMVTELAQTLIGCEEPRQEQDAWLARFLTSAPTWSLDGARLTLEHEGTVVRLEERAAASPRPLAGTRWVVETLIQGDRFTGMSGCNEIGGTARVAGGGITFSDVSSTRRMCEDDRMAVERLALSVLEGTVAYQIDGEVLHLRHPSGAALTLRAE